MITTAGQRQLMAVGPLNSTNTYDTSYKWIKKTSRHSTEIEMDECDKLTRIHSVKKSQKIIQNSHKLDLKLFSVSTRNFSFLFAC